MIIESIPPKGDEGLVTIDDLKIGDMAIIYNEDSNLLNETIILKCLDFVISLQNLKCTWSIPIFATTKLKKLNRGHKIILTQE